ncbi:FAD-dependent oxidoreductase, partial [bacterium]|nr:FAD-dependent oxidoreductase [bacterium]
MKASLPTSAIRSVSRIAVIGGGISGLSAAWLLKDRAEVTLFEANDYIGGHTNTVQIHDPQGGTLGVDTGFIVFNDWNYPILNRLFQQLGVEHQDTGMSFSVSVNQGEFEYCGSNLNGLFAQRSNLFDPRYYRLLMQIVRFNGIAKRALLQPHEISELSIAEFLELHRLSVSLARYYLLPMAAAIWSCPVENIRDFPALSLLRFFENHGLLNIKHRPQWKTVVGGSCQYVKRIVSELDGKCQVAEPVHTVLRSEREVTVRSSQGEYRFDAVIFACHADQAHAMIADLDTTEDGILRNFHYQKNTAVLHSDESIMPRRRNAWAAWNYHATAMESDMPSLAVTYWMNQLQHLPTERPYLVTLNPHRELDASKVHREIEYMHPVFDRPAIEAQKRRDEIQGRRRSWYCG